MRKPVGLVVLFAALLLLSGTATAQVYNPGVINVVGDRLLIEEDMGTLTLVWTGTVFFVKPTPDPVAVTVKFELSPSGVWEERGTSSTVLVSGRTAGARSLRERIAIATTDARGVTDAASLFNKDQVLRLSIAVRRPSAAGTAAALAQGDYEVKPLGYLLLNAARRGNLNEVRQILEAGGDVDSASMDNVTPLMMAAERGHKDVVRLLLEKDASTKNRTKGTAFIESPFGSRIAGGWNALMAAVSSGDADIVKLMLDKGVNVNSAMDDRRTPLLVAVDGKSPAVVSLLVERGADVNVVSDSGYSPLAMADVNGKGAIARIIAARGGKIIVPWDILSGSE
ncbi:MAG: ankyrin repeat domain-containing protein [Desulfomonile tiedjei]|nr:ankyrin repeat domain-containing protein [Desulfomonile tiedjei]